MIPVQRSTGEEDLDLSQRLNREVVSCRVTLMGCDTEPSTTSTSTEVPNTVLYLF